MKFEKMNHEVLNTSKSASFDAAATIIQCKIMMIWKNDASDDQVPAAN